jgi:hypothetical protein
MDQDERENACGKYRCICITCPGWDFDWSKYSTLFQYGIVGKETGDTGYKHLQCYFELKKQMRFNSIRKAIPEITQMRMFARKGSQEQAISYCKKDNDFYEFGEKKIVGRPSREILKSRVLNGERLFEP